jgi:hypothetical protein
MPSSLKNRAKSLKMLIFKYTLKTRAKFLKNKVFSHISFGVLQGSTFGCPLFSLCTSRIRNPRMIN